MSGGMRQRSARRRGVALAAGTVLALLAIAVIPALVGRKSGIHAGKTSQTRTSS